MVTQSAPGACGNLPAPLCIRVVITEPCGACHPRSPLLPPTTASLFHDMPGLTAQSKQLPWAVASRASNLILLLPWQGWHQTWGSRQGLILIFLLLRATLLPPTCFVSALLLKAFSWVQVQLELPLSASHFRQGLASSVFSALLVMLMIFCASS